MNIFEFLIALPAYEKVIILNLLVVALIQKRVHNGLTQSICTAIKDNVNETIEIPPRNIVSIIKFPFKVSKINKGICDQIIKRKLFLYNIFWVYSYFIFALTVFVFIT